MFFFKKKLHELSYFPESDFFFLVSFSTVPFHFLVIFDIFRHMADSSSWEGVRCPQLPQVGGGCFHSPASFSAVSTCCKVKRLSSPGRTLYLCSCVVLHTLLQSVLQQWAGDRGLNCFLGGLIQWASSREASSGVILSSWEIGTHSRLWVWFGVELWPSVVGVVLDCHIDWTEV